MQHASRRNFLKVAGAAAVGTAIDNPLKAASPAAGTIHTWVTDDDRRLAAGETTEFTHGPRSITQEYVALSPEQKFQEIMGFGACFTDGSCSVLADMPAEGRASLFHNLFHPSEMGLSVCRTALGACDNSKTVYSFCDGDADPELKRFSIEHDRAYILPILREARAVNPDLFLFASPWSPPGWMKDNGSMLGGCMMQTYMPSYAKYFAKFVEAYKAEGVPVEAVTVQNEVDADQQGLMPACFWPQAYEAEFVSEHLGPEFERSGINTKIWIIDHNYNLWGRAIAELETPGVRKYANAVAWHGYTGEPDWMSRVHNAVPGLDMYWTEGSPDQNDPEYMKCWVPWGQKISAILANHCRGFTAWTFATDERGKPNVGPYPLGGILIVDSKTHTPYHSGQYWAIGHFSKFVKRGARRIQSDGSSKEIAHCAFQNPDGSLVAVLTNPTATHTCQLRLGGATATLHLAANSITTVVIKGTSDKAGEA